MESPLSIHNILIKLNRINTWLVGSWLPEHLLAQVVDPVYTFTYAIWSKLKRNLDFPSKLQINLIRGKLQAIRKGSSSIFEYLWTVRNLANQSSMASFVSDTNRLCFTVGGLGPENESFITTVSLQLADLLFEDLTSLLRSYEVCPSSTHPDVAANWSWI